MKTRLRAAVIACLVLLSLGWGAAAPAGAADSVSQDMVSYRPGDLVVPNSVISPPAQCTQDASGIMMQLLSVMGCGGTVAPPAWSVSECTTAEGQVKSYCNDYRPGGPKDCSSNIFNPNSWGCAKMKVIPDAVWKDIVNTAPATRPKSTNSYCTFEMVVTPTADPAKVTVAWSIKSVDKLYYGSDPTGGPFCYQKPKGETLSICRVYGTSGTTYITGVGQTIPGSFTLFLVGGNVNNLGPSTQQLCKAGDTLLVTYWYSLNNADQAIIPGSFKNPTADLTPYAETQTVMECKNPDGTISKVTSKQTGTGAFSAVVCPSNTTYHSTTNNVLIGGAVVTTGPTFQVQPNFNTQFALCAGNSMGQGCSLNVKMDNEICVPLAGPCVEWYDTYTKQPSRFKCMWGPYEMPMKDCLFMRNSYRTELGISTNTTTNNYMTVNGPQEISVSVDITGDPDPRNTALTNSAVCFPSGWQKLNPVEWVLQPTRCALSWAFIPNQTTVKNMTTGLQTKMERVGFKPVSDAVGSAFAVVGTGGGCKGPGINFDVKNVHQTMYLWDACAAPMSTVAAFSYAISSVTIVGAGGFALIRAIGSAFGYRVSAGKGES